MRRKKASPWPFVGIGGLVSVGFLYGASVLFLPWWEVLVLALIWIALIVQATRWFEPRPKATAALVPIALLVWIGAVALRIVLKA